MPRRTLAQAIRAAGIILTEAGAADVVALISNPLGSKNVMAAGGWFAPLEGGLTMEVSYDLEDGWSVEVAETPAPAGRQISETARKNASALADALADCWQGDLRSTLTLLADGPTVLADIPLLPRAIVRSLAKSLRMAYDSVGPGGWVPVEDFGGVHAADHEDLLALWSVGILKSFPRVEAGSYCIEFESDDKLSGRS